jgi:hypothetical protein
MAASYSTRVDDQLTTGDLDLYSCPLVVVW